MSIEFPGHHDHIMLTRDVVSAYVGNNSLPAADLPALIGAVNAVLRGLAAPVKVEVTTSLQPAVPVKKSVTPEYLVCLEDGKRFKSLKRHLRSRYNLTPEEYRLRWNLPPDYPMVAPSYAAERSKLAKAQGLGQQSRESAPDAA